MDIDAFGKTVILAAGDFPTHRIPLGILAAADRVICCDSALAALLDYGMEPVATVGDMDSLPSDIRLRYRGKIVRVAEQDDNDLCKAFRYAISSGWRDIVILGATGKREDHTIGNISWLAEFVREAPGITMVTDNGFFQAFPPPFARISAEAGTQISVFGFSPDEPVTATGLKYEIRELKFPFWHTATLNEALGGEITFRFSKTPILVYQPFER